MNKYVKLLIGQTLSSFGISCVIACGLGSFPITMANLGISNLLNISFGFANVLIELVMLVYSLYKKEGIGVATILNTTIGGFLVDFFLPYIPTTPLAVIGLVLLPIGWAIIGQCGLGEPASNILMKVLIKQTKQSVAIIRTIEEICFLLIGILNGIPLTWFSICLSLGFGYIVGIVYKVMKYDPTKVKQNYIKLGLTKRIQ